MCRKGVCTISGSLKRGKAGTPTIGGHVIVDWEVLNKKKKWRKISGGQAQARKAFKFKAKLRYKGRWRVRVRYLGLAPWKPVKTKYTYFRV
jgi:hypothetical protein